MNETIQRAGHEDLMMNIERLSNYYDLDNSKRRSRKVTNTLMTIFIYTFWKKTTITEWWNCL